MATPTRLPPPGVNRKPTRHHANLVAVEIRFFKSWSMYCCVAELMCSRNRGSFVIKHEQREKRVSPVSSIHSHSQYHLCSCGDILALPPTPPLPPQQTQTQTRNVAVLKHKFSYFCIQLRAHALCSALRPTRQLSSGSDSGSISAAGELAGADYFVAAAAAAAAEADAGGNGTGQSSVGRRFDGGGGSGGSGDYGGKPAAGAESGRGVVRRSLAPSLFRRNSTSTIYLAAHDTLSDPDLDATIRCVCAVLRAHMIAGLADAREDCVSVGVGVGGTSSGSSSISGGGGVAPPEEGGVKGKGKGNQGDGMRGGEGRETWRGESVWVFDDPPEEGAPGPGATAGGSGGGSGAAAAVVPPLRDITAFYRNLYHRTCLKFDSIVLSLIYVERLMKVESCFGRFRAVDTCAKLYHMCKELVELNWGGTVECTVRHAKAQLKQVSHERAREVAHEFAAHAKWKEVLQQCCKFHSAAVRARVYL